ncbi:MAG: glycosyltransferase [Cyanobacteria bacterium J06621_11]
MITTVYNREQYLVQSIESALSQSEKNFELIIVDDGSTDDSVEIAEPYAKADPRIRLIKAKHQGRGRALETALSFASGQYLALLDSDDWLAPTALSETIPILETMPEVSMVYSDYYDVSASGEILKIGHRCAIPYSKERLLLDFMTFHFRLFRQQSLTQIGGIDPSFLYAPDYDLSLKLSEIGEVVHLKKGLYFYRRHQASISSAKELEQIRYSHQAVNDALVRRDLSDVLDVAVQLRPQLVFKHKKQTRMPSTPGKVFGIGLGKTGTTSLCAALRIMDYHTIHMPKSISEVSAYDAAADTSVAAAFRELDWRYPNSKFILTIRPLGDWLASWQKHDQRLHQLMGKELSDWIKRLRIRVFGQYEFSPIVWANTYEQHCEDVLTYFKHRPQQLLTYDLCGENSWQPLCHFLDKPIPTVSLPHQNASPS